MPSIPKGINAIPQVQIPAQWDPVWFMQFINTWLANGDVRNAIAGPGISITGQGIDAATIASEFADIINQPFVVTGPGDGLLTEESILQPEVGVTTVTTGSGNVVVGIAANGIGANQFRGSAAFSLVGNPTSGAANVQDISAPNDATKFLNGTLNFSSPAINTGANPTAKVGLVAVNGTATTNVRSDGAPALDESIAPTWTGNHQFNAEVGFNSTAPIAKPTVSGSKGSNTALASLLTALAAYGLVIDTTT